MDREVTDWRPMEEAPRDGTMVRLWVGRGATFDGKWVKGWFGGGKWKGGNHSLADMDVVYWKPID